MPFVLNTLAGPRNHVLDGGSNPLWEGTIIRGKWRLVVKYSDSLPYVNFAKERLNRSRCHLECKLGSAYWPKEACIGAVHTGATWRKPLNRPCRVQSIAMSMSGCLFLCICGVSPCPLTGSRDVKQWAVGLQRQQWRRLFVLEAEVAA